VSPNDVDLADAMERLANAIGRLGLKVTHGFDAMLTAEELADVLKIPARTIKDQLAAGRFPHHRFGKHYRFSPEDVAAILRMTEKKPLNGPMKQRASRVA
jgi:excisionase family DNA binding protein